MNNRRIMLLVGVSMGAIAGAAWYFGGAAQPDGPTKRVDARAVVAPPTASADASTETTVRLEFRAPETAELSPERSMVGLPFKPSESLLSDCLLVSWKPCEELKMFLERLAAEPRKTDWARDMEARIEKAVVSGERGKFRIRALECRSTRCALEAASEVDTLALSFDSDPLFNELMFPRASGIAREDDPQTGMRTIVSVQTWQSWEAFEAEEGASE